MANFGFPDFKKVLKANVSGTHAIAGAAVGTVGIGAVKYALNAIKVGGLPLSSKIPAQLMRFTPLIASLVAAFGGYMLLNKTAKKHASSFAIGAVSAGTVLTVADLLRTSFPSMGDLTTYRLPNMGYLTQTRQPRLNGLTASLGMLVPDTGSHKLNGLAQSAMGGDNGMGDLVEYDLP